MTRDDARLRMLLRWIPEKHADTAWVLGVIIIVALFVIAESLILGPR